MKHVPHLVVPAPWEESRLGLSIIQWRHVSKVLRMKSGDELTYTDGLGTIGQGTLSHQALERGEERTVDRPSELTLAVAPPASKDRQRFLVEKLAELGVAKLIWIETRHGKNRVANPAKVFSWVLAAVEQSRGAYLMETSEDLVPLDQLEGDLVFCHPGGSGQPGPAKTVVIGPEGGFADDEIPPGATLLDLGPTILRVETAAIAAAMSIRG
jgi:16S rRNA (uracil1498-N3)-methyltransferase